MRLCRLSLHHEGVRGIGHLVVSLFHRCITFCKEASYVVDNIGWGTSEMISDLDRLFGSRYFLSRSFYSFDSSGLRNFLTLGWDWWVCFYFLGRIIHICISNNMFGTRLSSNCAIRLRYHSTDSSIEVICHSQTVKLSAIFECSIFSK